MAVDKVEGVAVPSFGDCDMLRSKAYTDGLRHPDRSKMMYGVVFRRSRWALEDLLVVSFEIRRGVAWRGWRLIEKSFVDP